jgi:hypothetical protein
MIKYFVIVTTLSNGKRKTLKAQSFSLKCPTNVIMHNDVQMPLLKFNNFLPPPGYPQIV